MAECRKDQITEISIISRPTPRLLSFVLCLEWINGTYNTIHSTHSIDTPHTVSFGAIDAAMVD